MPIEPERPTPFQHQPTPHPHAPGSPIAGFDATRSLGDGAPRDPGTPFSRLVAIFATLVLIVGVVGMQTWSRNQGAAPPTPPAPGVPGAPPAAVVDTIPEPDLQMLLIGRMAMGVQWLGAQSGQPTGANAAQITGQMDDLAENSVRDRLRAAVIAGETLGAEAALSRLDEAATIADEIDRDIVLRGVTPDAEQTEAQQRRDAINLNRLPLLRADLAALRAIYESPSADDAPLSQGQRDALTRHHGFFGEVALAYNLDNYDPRRTSLLADGARTMVALVGAFGVGALAFLAGLVLFVIAIIRIATRGFTRRYARPSPGGSVYLETLALFLLGFVLVSLAAEPIQKATGVDLSFALVWLLLLVPFWPLLRGQRWTNHRYALGWNRGKGVFREIGAGIVGYLACLPIFAAGVVATLVLTFLIGAIQAMLGGDGDQAPMTHPVMEQLVGGSVVTLLVMLALAAVWAPLAEESIFRGAFYHHLRGGWGIVLASLVTGFVFAVIHPQGFAAVPALMSLGVSFALLREWRGSLIAPITAHAMHNGFLVTMLWFALS